MRMMAGRLARRVFVASSVRNLAKNVQEQMPAITIENIPYNGCKTFKEELEAGKLKSQLQEAEILLCDADALLLCLNAGAVPKLKWAQSTWAGVDDLMIKLNYTKPPGNLTITRCGGAFGELMAEYVVGYIIANERNFMGMKEKQTQKEWSNAFREYRPLSTLSVGILGYGSIGKQVAAYCKAMGMTVWGVSRSQSKALCPNVDHFRGLNGLGEMLQKCDYVCSILPNTPETTDLLSGGVLQKCTERKTVFINIGRGNVISEESLVKAIKEGWLGGAVLDVFREEPLPASSELWALPNVYITPHVSGVSMPHQVAKSFVGNLQLYESGQPLQYVVDWDKGY